MTNTLHSIENAMPRHFGLYKPGKLRGTRYKGRNSAVNLIVQDSTKVCTGPFQVYPSLQ